MHPLEKYRKDKNINQGELAKLLGISQQRISYYENGMAVPTKIAKIIFEKIGINLISEEQREISNSDADKILQLQREIKMKDELISEMKKRLALMEMFLEKEKAL